jgi:hypothetical protein
MESADASAHEAHETISDAKIAQRDLQNTASELISKLQSLVA